jgi:amidohydrolase
VLLRADIDALPIEEETDRPFRSRTAGRMHACGHDGHVAMALGVARVLASRAEVLPGRFVFLFQPAEELGGGALRMVEGGVLDELFADRMLSVHLVSLMPTGMVATRSGLFMSEAHLFRIDIDGTGGHGAMLLPEGNVVLAAAALVERLGRVVQGLTYEEVACTCSAGALHAGTAANVVPRRANRARHAAYLHRGPPGRGPVAARGGVPRALGGARRLGAALHSAAGAAGGQRPGGHIHARAAFARQVGDAQVMAPPPVTPSDDVSEFLARVPGCHLFVGAAPGGSGPAPMHHAPDFDIDERALHVGARCLAAAAVELAAG